MRNWPYTVISSKEQYIQKIKWCTDYIGIRSRYDSYWQCFWGGPKDPHQYTWHFKKSEHALMFALRWK